MPYFLIVSRLFCHPCIPEKEHKLTKNGRKWLSWDMEVLACFKSQFLCCNEGWFCSWQDYKHIIQGRGMSHIDWAMPREFNISKDNNSKELQEYLFLGDLSGKYANWNAENSWQIIFDCTLKKSLLNSLNRKRTFEEINHFEGTRNKRKKNSFVKRCIDLHS